MKTFLALVTVAAVVSFTACTASAPDSLSGLRPAGSESASSSGGSGGGDGAGSGGSSGGASSGAGSTPSPITKGLPCDVGAVFAANCQQCHGATPAYGATMPLVTWNDLQAAAPSGAGPVYQVVETRIHDTSKPMPPTPYPLLSSADATTIDNWVTAGAPSSRDTCAAPPADAGGPVVDPLPCTPDTQIRPASPYAMADSGEQYVCYGFDVTVTSKRQVIAMAPKIDNTSIIHHLLLFQSSSAVSSTPTPCSGGGSTGWSLIGGWAPGGKNLVLPPEAGFPETGTTHWVMQVHYSNAKGLANQTDASGFDLCTTDQLRANDAAVMASGSVNFSIPARGTLNLTCSFTFPTSASPVHVFSATPHMHLLGKSLSTSVLPGGSGTPVSVVSQPNWDFQTQLAYPTSNDVNPGDVIQTQCDWQNSTDTAVTFGEDTTNEMCFSFLAYYPAITSGLWSWVTPAALGTCQ